MPETGSLPQEVKEQLERIGKADVVIGLPALQAVDAFTGPAELMQDGQRILFAHPNGVAPYGQIQATGVEWFAYPVSPSERYLNASPGLYGSYQEVFQISQTLNAKCCLVWNTSVQPVSANIMRSMIQPLLERGFDLAIPNYAEARLGSLVNSSILHPLVRALYGKRIHFPMAIDLCFSARLVEHLLKSGQNTRRPGSQQCITTEAICAGMNVCEVNLPLDPPRPPESTDLSSVLSNVLGRLFLDLERNATHWQKSNGSQTLPSFGEPIEITKEEATVDVHPMIETFQLAYRNLREIWTVALPPATFLELKKLSALAAGEFRMHDDLWVRIVYDFALAHRQRVINREHLLRALTPLYLAWVASYALETRDLSAGGFQYNLERLALAYEKQKPYLLSRWRWPDRFNP